MTTWVDDVKKELAKKIAYQAGYDAVDHATDDDAGDHDDRRIDGWASPRPCSICSS